MNSTIKRSTMIAGLACLFASCGQRQTIPPSELNEIRQLAFESAVKRYVLSESDIESRYEPPKEIPYEPTKDSFLNAVRARRRSLEVRVPAVASIKGVRLTPSTPSQCFIEFDFEPNKNPHTELPPTEGTAKRFERPDGSHYWVIWK